MQPPIFMRKGKVSFTSPVLTNKHLFHGVSHLWGRLSEEKVTKLTHIFHFRLN